ncbi:MAG TPA: DUF3887 domain-containing protein [Bacteroidetes bacterium]|nr:DUF3887 domain-containing protein [Bacteroidota bacterium]
MYLTTNNKSNHIKISAPYLSSLIFIFTTAFTSCQTTYSQPGQYTSNLMADKFRYYFNAEQYDSIHVMFAPEMQKRTSLKKLKNSLHDLKSKVGQLIDMQLIRNKNGVYVFKGSTEITALDFTFAFNEVNQFRKMDINFHELVDAPTLERNTTKLILPFHGDWYVFWGGTTLSQNYHVAQKHQQGAFDFLINDKRGKSYKTDGRSNSDYYAFGKEIIAPCDGKIIRVLEGVKDNTVPGMNKIQAYGNCVMLETKNKEYIVFAHLKMNSIKVKKGQKIKQGDILGLCGNSGNSTEPHLHFSVQNIPELQIATGAKCYFEKIIVNGKIKEDYMPVRGDVINNK